MNPCIGVCKFVAGACQGCKRTPQECRQWWDYDDATREKLLEELPSRA
jgi:predicted Fe-S protein YdhL (DUF1289 family)